MIDYDSYFKEQQKKQPDTKPEPQQPIEQPKQGIY
jgi:uncharacterized short protein YbdD (DUF466 family)